MSSWPEKFPEFLAVLGVRMSSWSEKLPGQMTPMANKRRQRATPIEMFFWLFSNWNEYDRSFTFNYEPNSFPFGS